MSKSEHVAKIKKNGPDGGKKKLKENKAMIPARQRELRMMIIQRMMLIFILIIVVTV